MDRNPKPWLLCLQLENTPSVHDPKGATEFYQALGTFIVAWGRLETHFIACILSIVATDATKELAQRIPNAWSKRSKIWQKAFRISSVLKPHEKEATFLEQMNAIAEIRHKLVHGFWEPFNHGEPTSINVHSIKHLTGSENGVDHSKMMITTFDLQQHTREADTLNIGLQRLSLLLKEARGPIPKDIYVR
jgi:hypothetical protein